jgi:hypothetical protein
VICVIIFTIILDIFVKLSVIFVIPAVDDGAWYRVKAKKRWATWKTFEDVGSATWFDENTKCSPFGMPDDEIVWFCVVNGQVTLFGT